jgi:hypothetical protein
MTFLHGVPPHAIGSATTMTFATPSRLGAMLKRSPVPLSNKEGASPQITLAP